MNQSLNNDSDDTITLDEQISDSYEPSPKEIRDFAIHLGMKLPEDNRYLELARDGLKAKLPEEWKVQQKVLNGEEVIFYKNKITGTVTQDHPCDQIYRHKYQEAKKKEQRIGMNSINNSKKGFNQNFNNDSAITLEEEFDEGYEPNDQEIAEYAMNLGMQLPEDNKYLDIAKAGLKAKLPEEWKAQSKIINGQEIIQYKNKKTGQLIQEHPCDMIYKKKYLEAKQIDQKNGNKKSSGVNKLKQNIQQYRNDGVFDIQEDQSFLVESNVHNQNYNYADPVPPLQSSAMQNIMQTVDQEFAKMEQDYEDERRQEIVKKKEEIKQKLNKMELMLLNEADPELFELKEEYDRKKEQLSKTKEEKQKKSKKRVEEELENNLANQKSQLAKQLERNIENYEYEQEKSLKMQMKKLQQELQDQHKDVIGRINQRKKELTDSNSKQMQQLQQKKQNVENQFNRYKKELIQEMRDKLSQIDSENLKKYKQETEQTKQQLRIKAEQRKKELQFQLVDLKQENQNMVKQIRLQVENKYKQKFNQIEMDFNDQIENIKLSESQMMQSQVFDYKNKDIEDKKLEQIHKYQQMKEKLIQQLSSQLHQFDSSTIEKYQQMKKNLEETQRQKLEKIQKDYEKKYGKNLGNGKEINLCMEINQMKGEIHENKEGSKQLQRKKEEILEQLGCLKIVVSKFNLQNELKQKEVIKFELQSKQFSVDKQKLEDKAADKELEQLEKQYTQIVEKHHEKKKKKDYQVQQMVQSVNELREILAQNQSSFNSKGQSQLFRQSQPGGFGNEMNIQENLSIKASLQNDESILQEKRRNWESILLNQRVALSKEEQTYKSDKEQLKLIQKKLTKDLESVKNQIKMAKQLNQNNQMLQQLKNMKQEVKLRFDNLGQEINKINKRKSVIKEKKKVLEQMTSIQIDANLPLSLHSLEQLQLLYNKIGDEEQRESSQLQISKLSDDYLSNLVFDTIKPNDQQNNRDNYLVQQVPKVLNYDQIQNFDELQVRMQLLQQKDWLQNFKYKLTGTNYKSFNSRMRFQRYQDYLKNV